MDRQSNLSGDLLDLIVLFRKFGLQAQRYEQAGLDALGTTPARVNLLCELLQCGPAPMQSLANALSIAPRSVTSLVDALEREGKVERSAHPTDRRSTIISLSPLGKKEAEVTGPMLRKHMGSLFGALSQNERKGLMKTVRKLMDEIDAREPRAS